MSTVHFTKMHGAGNDYIYVNTLLYNIPNPALAAEQWSQYHTGIGSDGLVMICEPHDNTKADYRMRIFNADGSEAMMCGNASRCIGKYLYEKDICKKDTIRLETLSGVKVLKLHLSGDKKTVESVTVDMLEPRTEVPEQFTGATPAGLIKVQSSNFKVQSSKFVSMGNPHYVIFVDDINKVDITSFGQLLERDEAFPERCNIEFAQLTGKDQIRTRVWERGSGITMACGTGACATAVAANLLNLAGRESTIVMDGGELHIRWDDTDGHVYMTGPAAFVFEGEISLPA